MRDYHDKRKNRIAERNELAKQILVADLTRTGEATTENAIAGANTMMVALYGEGWDKYDPILDQQTVEETMKSLHRAILMPMKRNFDKAMENHASNRK
jgi:hypothetical protein